MKLESRAAAIYRDIRYIAIFFIYRDMRYIAIFFIYRDMRYIAIFFLAFRDIFGGFS